MKKTKLIFTLSNKNVASEYGNSICTNLHLKYNLKATWEYDEKKEELIITVEGKCPEVVNFFPILNKTLRGGRETKKVIGNPKRNLYIKLTDVLSARTLNCLKNDFFLKMDFDYVGDLVQLSEGNLLKIRGFGDVALQEIKEKLGRLGLSLGMTFPNTVWLTNHIKPLNKKYWPNGFKFPDE